jgi:hypothetical protein
MDDTNRLVLVYMAAACWLLSMMAVVIECRKRKRHVHAPIAKISYGPIERDRVRIAYLNNKIRKNDVNCVNMLRLTKESFFHFCDLVWSCGLLQDTIFELEHKSKYYTHLVANPNIATAFMGLPLFYKITWVTTFVNERCMSNYVHFTVDVSLYFRGPKYFGDGLCMNNYGSNYHICMDLNMLGLHYNYLILDLCHYLILLFYL